jgi:hypothetical protein
MGKGKRGHIPPPNPQSYPPILNMREKGMIRSSGMDRFNSYTYIFLFRHRQSTVTVFYFGQIYTGVCEYAASAWNLSRLLIPTNLSAYKENL